MTLLLLKRRTRTKRGEHLIAHQEAILKGFEIKGLKNYCNVNCNMLTDPSPPSKAIDHLEGGLTYYYL